MDQSNSLGKDFKQIDCEYWKKCLKYILARLDTSFLNNDNHICFCQSCHDKRKDVEIYQRGVPAKTYEIPLGYAGFAIKIDGSNIQDMFKNYHNSYHGTIEDNFNAISKSQMKLLRPGDVNSQNQTVIQRTDKCRFRQDKIRLNEFTNEKYFHKVNRIFTSPCIHYATLYSAGTVKAGKFDGGTYSIVLQCRIKPGSYELGPNTSTHELGVQYSECTNKLSNATIEYMLDDSKAIIITRVLIRCLN